MKYVYDLVKCIVFNLNYGVITGYGVMGLLLNKGWYCTVKHKHSLNIYYAFLIHTSVVTISNSDFDTIPN